MKYKLVYTSRAKSDLEQATQYIARFVPDTAERWFAGFVTVLSKLRDNPLVFGTAPESKYVEDEIRQIIYRTKSRRLNRALFTIRENTVYILCIRRPGQDILSASETDTLLAGLKTSDED